MFSIDNKKAHRDTIEIILYVITCSMPVYSRFNQLSLRLLLPLLFFLTIAFHSREFYATIRNRYFVVFSLLMIWVFMSCCLAYEPTVAFRTYVRLVLTFFVSVVTYVLARTETNIKWLYLAYVFFFIIILFYARANYGIEIAEDSGERMGEAGVLNANVFSYYVFFASAGCLLLANRYGWSNMKFMGLIAVIAVFTVLVAFTTASRQTLAIQFPMVVLFSVFYYSKYKKGKNVFLLAILLASLFLLPFVLDMYSGSYLQVRNEDSIMEDNRITLIMRAAKVGFEHPIFGVGYNNFFPYFNRGAFSHCTYAELFACSGLPAMLFFVALLLRFMADQLNRYKRTRDKMFLCYFAFGLMYFIYNFLYVFIYTIWMTSFFFLVASDSDQYYRKLKEDSSKG